MRWIPALALDTWANTQIGRAEVARLVGKLIWATAPSINSFRFPAGDVSQIPGFDGHLITPIDFVHPYVPAGESVWEFATDQDYFGRAQREYAKRTADPGAIDPAQCTFVFVTPRIWNRPDRTLLDWEREMQRQEKWRNVTVLDAVKLEHWLEEREAVAKDFAREVRGLSEVAGLQSVREFWDEYSERFNPKLTEAVVLAGRNGDAEELLNQLVGGAPQAIKLQADSRDEVVSFAVAAIRTAEPSLRDFLEARTLVVESKDAVSQRTVTNGMVFLPRGTAIDLASSLSYLAPTLIPSARMDSSVKALQRPNTYELSEALKLMVRDDERAERLARECGRSVTILARRIPRVDPPSPPWSSSPGLLAALMAGAWDDSVEGDRKVIAVLAGREYDDFDADMRHLLALPEPLEREGSVWKIRAPVDTFVQLGSLLTSRDVERLRSVAATVFGETDPALDLPVSERRFAPVRGVKMRHSEWIRDGLATTLLQIAVLHRAARFAVTGVNPQAFVDQLVSSLPGLFQDARLLLSLGRQLPWLMEAAPHPLLSALEHLLEGDGKGILPIFDEDDTLFGKSSLAPILWSLEILAWNPKWLPRTALALAGLVRLDPDGRRANRPMASLATIFKPWLPQTKASLAQRLAAIDGVVAKEPDVGWRLVLGLLPVRQDSGTYNPKPRLRESSSEKGEILTNRLVYQTYGEAISRAIQLARGKVDRVLSLLKAMDAFRHEDMELVCGEAEVLADVISDDDRFFLWTEVRNLVAMHTGYRTARWTFPSDIVDRLRALRQRLQPTDPVLSVQWLFDQHFPQLDDAAEIPSEEMIAAARSRAISSLYANGGESRVAELACRAKTPGLVGVAVGDVLKDVDDVDRMLTTTYALPDVPDQFLMALSSRAYDRFGPAWSARIAERARQGLPPEKLANLLLSWSNERVAWDLADALGAEVVLSFWSQRLAFPVRGERDDKERAAREYLKAGRAVVALRALSSSANELPTELLLEILERALPDLTAANLSTEGNLWVEIAEVFDKLSSRQDVSDIAVARCEYAYLPFLKHRGSTLKLHQLMAQEGAFFVSILCDVFRPASGAEEDPRTDRKARAQYGYELLSSMTDVPGFVRGEKQADEEELLRWVSDVRTAARDKDRAKIADQFIGQVLAHAPSDPVDDAWPHSAVRRVFEEVKSDDLELGINVGRSNMGGAHAINSKFPAALEHERAAQARKWAIITSNWSRTSAMLTSMAEYWESVARHVEQHWRQEAMRD